MIASSFFKTFSDVIGSFPNISHAQDAARDPMIEDDIKQLDNFNDKELYASKASPAPTASTNFPFSKKEFKEK